MAAYVRGHAYIRRVSVSSVAPRGNSVGQPNIMRRGIHHHLFQLLEMRVIRSFGRCANDNKRTIEDGSMVMCILTRFLRMTIAHYVFE